MGSLETRFSITRLKEWQFFVALTKASPGLAAAWWSGLLLLGLLPAAFAIAMGGLVGAVRAGATLALPLAFVGGVFLLLQVLSPIHPAISAQSRRPDGLLAL